MSTKLEAAARQALGVLRQCLDHPDADDAITALREALAEQAQKATDADLLAARAYADQRWDGEDVPIYWLRHFVDGLGRQAAQQAAEPVAMRYRFHYPDDGSKPYRTSEWKYTQGPWDKIPGNARDVSALPLHPAPTQQPVLVRDLAEILGVTVTEVCHELEECGGPRRSTNMAVSGVEALAVAAQLKQAAEPVAWANPNDLQNFDMKVRTNGGPLHTVPLCLCNPAPTQQPLTDAMVTAAAREFCKIYAGECQVNEQDTWKLYGDQFKRDARAILDAALGITGSKT